MTEGSPRRPLRDEPTVPIAALLLAGTLFVLAPMTGGAWRDQHLGVLLLAIAAAIAVFARPAALVTAARAIPAPAFAAFLAAIALWGASTAAYALGSPLPDAAASRLAIAGVAGGAALAGALFGASGHRTARLFVDAATAGCVLVAVFSILRSTEGLRAGASWPFANHGQLGGLLATGAVLAFAGSGWERHLHGRSADGAAAFFLRLGLAAFLAITATATQSRSSVLALAATLVVAVWAGASRTRSTASTGRGRPGFVRARVRAAVAAAGALAVLALAVQWVGAESRWDAAAIRAEAPVTDRIAAWKASLALAGEAPLLGHGLGTYGSAIWRHTPEAIGGAIEHAHSQPLEVLAERGLVGLFVLSLAGLVAVRSASGVLRRDAHQGECRAALIAALVLPLQSLVDVVLATPALVAVPAALLGIAAGGYALDASSAGTPEKLGRMALFPMAAAAVLGTAAVSWLSATADRARAQTALERGDVPGALEMAERSLGRFPADRLSARRLGASGDLARFGELAALDPWDPFAALGAAAWHESEGRGEEAEREILRAIDAFPDGVTPRQAAIAFFARRGRFADALREAQDLVARHPARAAEVAISTADLLGLPPVAETLAPTDPAGRRRVAEWLAQRGSLDAAARLIVDGSPEALLALGRIALADGRIEDARALARSVAKQEPANPHALALLVDTARSDEDLEEAAASLAEPATRDATLARRRVAALDRLGRRPEADRWLDAAIEARPEDVDLLRIRLERRRAQGEIAAAMTDARTLIRLRPREPDGHIALASMYEARGMRAGARQLYRDALELDPARAEARHGLERTAPER